MILTSALFNSRVPPLSLSQIL